MPSTLCTRVGGIVDGLTPGQTPAWVPAAPFPRLVTSAMRAPASATAAATRNALCIPLTNVAWLISVIALAIWCGVPRVTGATPTETALFTPASWDAVSVGRCAACQLAGSMLATLADITARKKAEAYLEFLGKHDVLTKLYNRSFYVDEINRLERKNFSPVTIIIADLNGLKIAKGYLVAIFDADFLPQPDFLRAVVPHFIEDARVGMVQARWGHLNREHSLLTRTQALMLDGHHLVENRARSVDRITGHIEHLSRISAFPASDWPTQSHRTLSSARRSEA